MTDDHTHTRLRPYPEAAGGPFEGGVAKEQALGDEALAELVQELRAAILSDSRSDEQERLAQIVARGIPVATLIDEVIPATARELGDEWCQDTMSFVQVTIASSRLQAWLRKLDRAFEQAPGYGLDGPNALMVVPSSSGHYLGGLVVTSQLRRMGASVTVLLGEPLEALAHTLMRQHFDMVLISASAGDSLENLRSVVNMVRTGVAPAPKVVVGGTLMDTVPDVARRVGADVATRDPKEALVLCGRGTSIRDRSRTATPTAPPPRNPERVR